MQALRACIILFLKLLPVKYALNVCWALFSYLNKCSICIMSFMYHVLYYRLRNIIQNNLLDFSVYKKLEVTNMFFRHKVIQKFIWT
jgi:hypothetical protein